MILDRFRLDGRVAIVTGAGKGIGAGIAVGLAEAGADVVCAARTEADIDATAAAVGARGRRGLAVRTDVTVTDDLHRLVDTHDRRARPARHPGEQRGRLAPAPGARDERARVRSRAAVQRHRPRSC